MRIIPGLTIGIAAMFLSACGGEESVEVSVPAAKARSYAYKVDLSFTPRTLTKLEELGEKVTVSNLYYGAPTAGAETKSEGTDQVSIGENAIDVGAANQIVRVTVAPFKPERLKDIAGEPKLLINVFSARKAAADNLISCDIYDGDLASAEASAIPIHCDLIEPEILIEHEKPAPLGYP